MRRPNDNEFDDQALSADALHDLHDDVEITPAMKRRIDDQEFDFPDYFIEPEGK